MVEAESGRAGAVRRSAAAGSMVAGGVPVVFTGLGAGEEASGGAPPLARGVFSGVFPDCMVAGGFSVGLVLKLFILLYLILRGFFYVLGVRRD